MENKIILRTSIRPKCNVLGWVLLTVRMYISIMALGQQTISTSRSAMLRLRRKRLVEDRIDLEVRITISTSTFPTTPTASTRLNIELATGNSTRASYL